jgi:transcriptional regulator with XRE-family HTH domain
MSRGKRVKAVHPPDFNAPISPETIAQAIKSRRTQLGLDMKTTAMLSGVSIVTLSKIEHASKGVRLESVLKVAQALGMTIKIVDWRNDA